MESIRDLEERLVVLGRFDNLEVSGKLDDSSCYMNPGVSDNYSYDLSPAGLKKKWDETYEIVQMNKQLMTDLEEAKRILGQYENRTDLISHRSNEIKLEREKHLQINQELETLSRQKEEKETELKSLENSCFSHSYQKSRVRYRMQSPPRRTPRDRIMINERLIRKNDLSTLFSQNEILIAVSVLVLVCIFITWGFRASSNSTK